MRKVKIKSLIFGYLANAGEPRNTIEICEWINKNDKREISILYGRNRWSL